MKPYDSYKPSGIDWIGEIPSHWEVNKLKYFFNFFDNIRVPLSSEEREGLEKLYDYYGASGVIDKVDKYLFDGEYILIGEDGANLLTRNSPLAYKASGKFWVNNHAHILQPIEGNLDFYTHQLECRDYSIYVTGSAQPKLTAENLINIELIVPPLPEQTAIAHFLDQKTAQLDTLIDRKRRLIELLREEKTALINEAVTKGIHPDVPMKDSGVEWLGEIPAHWEVKKLKHVSTVRSGFALNGSMGGENSVKFPYLRVANVQDGYLKLNDVTEVDIEESIAKRYLLQAGDLLMNEGGDYDKLGRGCVWHGQINPCLHQNHVFAVRMNEGVNPNWVNALTLTTYARQYFMLYCKQSTNLASISQTNIKELPVLIPPKSEQNEILLYLDTETARIDYTISRIEREVELMQEYRTALISEVVTGKVKVV